MNEQDFKNKKVEIDTLASKYKWNKISDDSTCGRLSYSDELSVYRIDIYTSRMTVCILPKGGKNVYLKRTNFKKIEEIFRNPFKY